jgi:hypothetical protein
LLTDKLVGHKIDLTGPHSHTNAELVQIIGTVVNRRLRYREAPPAQVHEGFVALGFSAAFADAYIGFLSATVDKPAAVTREVEIILGLPAQSFADWVAHHRALFTR